MPGMVRPFTRTRQTRREGSMFSQEHIEQERANNPGAYQRISQEAGCCATVFFTCGLIILVTGIVLLIIGVTGPHATQTYTNFAISGGVLIGVGIITLVASIIYSKKFHPRTVEPMEDKPEQQHSGEATKHVKREKKMRKKLRKSRKENLDMGRHSEPDDTSVASMESSTKLEKKHLANLPPLKGVNPMHLKQTHKELYDKDTHTEQANESEEDVPIGNSEQHFENEKPEPGTIYGEEMVQPDYGHEYHEDGETRTDSDTESQYDELYPSNVLAVAEQEHYEQERQLYTPGPKLKAPPPPVYDVAGDM